MNKPRLWWGYFSYVFCLLHSYAGTNQFRFSGIISAFYSTPCMKYEHKSREEFERFNSLAKIVELRAHLVGTWAIDAWNRNIKQTKIDAQLRTVVNHLAKSMTNGFVLTDVHIYHIAIF